MFHDEIVPRLNDDLKVLTPAPAGSVTTPLLRSRIGTIGEPSLKFPTAEKLFGAFCVMITVCGNACDGGNCWRPGLSFCGLREKPARTTILSPSRYANPIRGVSRSFCTGMLQYGLPMA